jgi:hypothetical protein
MHITENFLRDQQRTANRKNGGLLQTKANAEFREHLNQGKIKHTSDKYLAQARKRAVINR